MLRNKIKKYNPLVVMLQETKCDDNTITTIQNKCWRGCTSMATTTMGCVGGLSILWDLEQIILENEAKL